MDGILTGITNPVQSGFESNGNERVLNISQSSRTGASQLDAVYFHTRDTSWEKGLTPLQRYSRCILQP